MNKRTPIQVGDTVRLTAAFLRATGQYTGPEPFARWRVLQVNGSMVTTNEPRPDDGMFTPEELAADPMLQYRHVNVANLERCRS